ncbi:hypothetical protein QTG54_012899 [Skeletonema marinoi]|uniref:Uncharacterized protein n=1 Tax=Skeletonema marinoi TaxID=267567 RepID=A0AAD8XYL9_9STRA|nr:hypothetical protein QTG54_012899 [Skeletonema marinoi]
MAAQLHAFAPTLRNQKYGPFFTNNDPFRGIYDRLCAPYAVPLAGGGETPSVVRNLAASSARASRISTAFVQAGQGKMRVMLQMDRVESQMGLDDSVWTNRNIIQLGDLCQNQSVMIELADYAWNMGPTVRVGEHALNQTIINGNPETTTVGPFDAADAGTELVRGRKLSILPPPFVEGLLAIADLTPMKAYVYVYARCVAEGWLDSCAPLLDHLRCAITVSVAGDDPAIWDVNPPRAVLLDEVLIQRRNHIIMGDFPELDGRAATMQQNAVATEIGGLRTDLRDQREAEIRRRDVSQAQVLKAYFGETVLLQYMRIRQVDSVDELPEDDLFKLWASAKKNMHLAILQSRYDQVKSLRQEEGLQPFRFHEQGNEGSAQDLAFAFALVAGDGAAPRLSDIQTMAQPTAEAPILLLHSRQQILRLELAVCSLILRYGKQVAAPHVDRAYIASASGQTEPKRGQRVPIPDMMDTLTAIENENPWKPETPPAFLTALGLQALAAVERPAAPPALGRMRLQERVAPPAYVAPRLPLPEPVFNNTQFNNRFQPFKDSAATCRDIRNTIGTGPGQARALPLSRIDQKPMCLAFHAKGVCNPRCGLIADHVPYTNAQYDELFQWCQECFTPALPTSNNPIPISTTTTRPPSSATRQMPAIIQTDQSADLAVGWEAFVKSKRGRGDIGALNKPHPANRLLHQYKVNGTPVRFTTPPWTADQQIAALKRGPHPSCSKHIEFLEEEFVDMMNKGQWARWVGDYSFYGINKETVPLAATESMQFGTAFERFLRELLLADPALGPIYLSKTDVSDGFYRIDIAPADVPKLGLLFPQEGSVKPDDQLVALPLVLPMGWTLSPPVFTTATETVADITNAAINAGDPFVPHPLENLASLHDEPILGNPAVLNDVKKPTMALNPSREPQRKERVVGAQVKSTPLVETLYPTPLVETLAPPDPQLQLPPRDPCLPTSTTHAAYVDVFVDDFFKMAQGEATRRRVRSLLFHVLDSTFRPNDFYDSNHRREPNSIKKLRKGDCSWTQLKLILGWIVDTATMTISLPPHRVERLAEILASIPTTQKRTSVKNWHKILGELRSMSLALPGSRHLFSQMQNALSTGTKTRIALKKGVHQALEDFRWMHANISDRPTRIAELVPLTPQALGYHDASGSKGAGGAWFPTPDLVPRGDVTPNTPLLWRLPWPQDLIDKLVSDDNPTGTVTSADFELAGGLLHLDALAHSYDIRERTVVSKTDNLNTMFWERKESCTTDSSPAYLLRLFGIHQRHHRYISRHDYQPGVSNQMADDASRLFHLTDTQFLAYFNSTYPQNTSYKIVSPRPEMISCVILALHRKTSTTGKSGFSSVIKWASTPYSKPSKTKYPSFKSSSTTFDMDLVQPTNITSSLAQLKSTYGDFDLITHSQTQDGAEQVQVQNHMTYLSLGAKDPRLTDGHNIDFRIRRMLNAYSKEDPPPNRVKPVPVQVLRNIMFIAKNSDDPALVMEADMIAMAFFFLLRPGEYTATKSESTPFELKDVQLWLGCVRLNLETATDAEILASTFGALTFDKQKNSVRGEVIGHARSGDQDLCPVRCIARRVVHLRRNHAAPNTPLATAFQADGTTFRLKPAHITTTLKQAVTFLGPSALGFLPADVSARSLRAAGANALLCGGVDTDVIRLLGRWRSDEMLKYLHTSAEPLMRDYARQMLTGGAFTLIPNQDCPSF